MRRDVFQAIADPNRRAIIGLLSKRKMTVNAVAERFPISRPAISRHLKILQECGLVVLRQQGRERLCELRPDRLIEVADWIERSRQLWSQRFDRLDDYLSELQKKEKSHGEN